MLTTLFLGMLGGAKENVSGDSVVNVYFLGLGEDTTQYLSGS